MRVIIEGRYALRDGQTVAIQGPAASANTAKQSTTN
jgi:hypothetical protein